MRNYLTAFVTVVSVLAAILSDVGAAGHAQPIVPGWSSPELLYRSSTQEFRNPQIAVEVGGRVHVFWESTSLPDAESPGGGPNPDKLLAPRVFHSSWDGNYWSKPTDVIASTGIHLLSAAWDPSGYIDVLVSERSSQIKQWRAPSSSAGLARSWKQMGPVEQGLPHGFVLNDRAGQLHRVYGGLGERGPMHQLSTDGGRTWSTARNVSRTAGPGAAADWVRAAVDDSGAIHVVWTEFQLPSGWPPLGVYYSRSDDGGTAWLPARQMAGAGYDQINVVIYGSSAAHVAWNGMAGVTGRFHSWSPNSGKTWSDPVMVSTGSGTVGPPGMVVDGSGDLHLTTTDGNGLSYARWRGGAWEPTTYVPTGDEMAIPPSGRVPNDQIRQIEEPTLAIDPTGVLHTVFWDRRRDRNVTYLWHSTLDTGSPLRAVATSALPTAPVPTPQVAASATPVQYQTLAPRPEPLSEDSRPQGVAGLWAAAIAVGTVVAASAVLRRFA